MGSNAQVQRSCQIDALIADLSELESATSKLRIRRVRSQLPNHFRADQSIW